MDKASDVTFGPFNRFKLLRSGLDVWFEDQNASDHAYEVIQAKIAKAKAKRGNRLREILT